MTAVSSEYRDRAADLLEILKGSQKEESFFASSFLDAVPLAQFRDLVNQLNTQYGEPLSVSRIIPASNTDGTVEITYTKAVLAMRMVLDSNAPYPVVGLLITGANMKDDNIGKIADEIAALSGLSGFQVADLSGDKPQTIVELNSSEQLAIGSTFKIYVLAELSRSIKAGERQWSDVTPLNRKSLPSGVLQDWPNGTPLTLQTLATMMISISDNSATDILIDVVGRDKVDEMMRRTGHTQPDKTAPMLKTLEMFALKMPSNSDLRQRYIKASETEQKQLLADEQARLGIDSVSIANLANEPVHIDTIEWFASPTDISNLLNHILKTNDPVVLDIIKVNSIIPPGDALRWNYIGGKGGSEPGVISFAFLTKSKSGKTYAISGSWNNSKAPVDNDKFTLIFNRLPNLIASR
ncbi:serine hydrolase [Parasphingorhabdus litoris]|nr:serine hydrolase [Parasphingorhabdus litoris]